MRNTVAHGAALSPKQWERHAAGNVLLAGNLAGNRYSTMYEGRLVEFELSSATLNQLSGVVGFYFAAFREMTVDFD